MSVKHPVKRKARPDTKVIAMGFSGAKGTMMYAVNRRVQGCRPRPVEVEGEKWYLVTTDSP